MQYPYIIVSLKKKTLTLFRSAKDHRVFPIAIGKQATPPPQGTWYIQNKKILTDDSPFGSHWLGLNLPGYGIHGTNQPSSIGESISGGCIRMYNDDIQWLFLQIYIGTPVIIIE